MSTNQPHTCPKLVSPVGSQNQREETHPCHFCPKKANMSSNQTKWCWILTTRYLSLHPDRWLTWRSHMWAKYKQLGTIYSFESIGIDLHIHKTTLLNRSLGINLQIPNLSVSAFSRVTHNSTNWKLICNRGALLHERGGDWNFQDNPELTTNFYRILVTCLVNSRIIKHFSRIR